MSIILLILCLSNTAIVMFLVCRTAIFHRLLPRPERFSALDSQLPAVSVIVPARNEQSNIERCLQSLLAQDYPNFEIVVLDDNSTDDTALIVRELAAQFPRLKPFRNDEQPPPGWVGKCFAIIQAVPHASGAWYVFVDADTVHQPDMLRHGMAYAISQKASMLSFWSKHALGSFGERLTTPAYWNFFYWLDYRLTVNDPASTTAYAIGHCMFVERDAYLSVGGHRAIKDWILEDHGLAMLLKNAGFAILTADGRSLYQVRMYKSFKTFWLGWTKNDFAIMHYSPAELIKTMVCVFCMAIAPTIQAGLLALLVCCAKPLPDLAALYFLVAAQLALITFWFAQNRSFYTGLSWAYLFLLPISGLILLALKLYSAWLVLAGGQINWKGRRYQTTRPRTPPEPVPWV